MAIPKCKYLFNFASSYSGGGKQILLSYLRYFDAQGGAFFIINENLKLEVEKQYTKNYCIFVRPKVIERFFRDGVYLNQVQKICPELELFFSYGIPIYRKLAKINWLHISNLIPISPNSNYLTKIGMLKMYILRSRLKRYNKNVNVLSADSEFAVQLSAKVLALDSNKVKKKALKNGFDQKYLSGEKIEKEDYAITVGTQPYKDLISLMKVFDCLAERREVTKLKIVGDMDNIPKYFFKRENVEFLGIIPHSEVMGHLRRAKVFLSTSMIENSSVASLEGVYLCERSYLSMIGPHKEMIEDLALSPNKVRFSESITLYEISEEIPENKLNCYDWNKLNKEFHQCIEGML